MKEGGKLLKYWNDRIFKYWNIVLEQDSFNNLGFASKEDVNSTMEMFYLLRTAFTLIIVFLCIYRDSNGADDDVDDVADDDVE